MMFVRACIRESQEMVLDAHDRAFAFLKGACTRGIYDNLRTAVEAVFTGKERHYNRRYLKMCSHYLVQPVACTPASGWVEPARCHRFETAGEGVRSRTKSGWCESGSSRPACGSRASTS